MNFYLYSSLCPVLFVRLSGLSYVVNTTTVVVNRSIHYTWTQRDARV